MLAKNKKGKSKLVKVRRLKRNIVETDTDGDVDGSDICNDDELVQNFDLF